MDDCLNHTIFFGRSRNKVDRSDLGNVLFRLVNSRKMKLEIEIEVDVPLDIIEDKKRIRAVEDGLGRSISKGLYEQGVSFKINKISSRIE
jgi:hypothetical protein